MQGNYDPDTDTGWAVVMWVCILLGPCVLCARTLAGLSGIIAVAHRCEPSQQYWIEVLDCSICHASHALWHLLSDCTGLLDCTFIGALLSTHCGPMKAACSHFCGPDASESLGCPPGQGLCDH